MCNLSLVARMSEAKCGAVLPQGISPGFRFAHPGYALASLRKKEASSDAPERSLSITYRGRGRMRFRRLSRIDFLTAAISRKFTRSVAE